MYGRLPRRYTRYRLDTSSARVVLPGGTMKAPPLRAVPLLLTLFVPPAAAQTGLEIGAFAQASYWEESIGFDQGSGGGGARIGFFPIRNLLLEGEGGFVPAQAREEFRVSYIPLR